MRVLIIGASGFVGSYLYRFAKERGDEVLGTGYQNIAAELRQLDIRQKKAVERLINSHQPEVVFLPAGMPKVDWCEEHPQESWEINVVGVKNVVKALKQRRVPLVFYSTEYVFGNQAGPYREEDQAGPLNVYGRHKLVAEKMVAMVEGLILRTVIVYGNEIKGKNFAEQVIRHLSQGEIFKAATDQISTPTDVVDLAAISYQLLEKKISGIVHVAGPERLSRANWARQIAANFGLRSDLIKPVLTEQLQQKAKRPLAGGLVIDKLKRIIGRPTVGLKQGLSMMKQKRRLNHGKEQTTTPRTD